MPQPPHADPGQLELIVAYLDGELSADESARVEQRLAADEAFRGQLQGMQRAWDALDELPAATVGDNFCRTTMEMVVETASKEVADKTAAIPIQRRKRSFTAALFFATIALLGLLVFRIAWTNPNDQLLADLAVVDQIDVYSQFENLDFLSQLQRKVQGIDWPIGVAPKAIDGELRQFQLVSNAESRPQWIHDLSPEDRDTLRAKFNRFRALPESQQQQLRDLQQEVADVPELQETLIRYGRWLSEIPASRQYQLREASTADRVAMVQKLLRQQVNEIALELSPEELENLLKAVRGAVRQHFIQTVPPEERRRLRSKEGIDQLHAMMRSLRQHSPQQGAQFFQTVLQSLPEKKRQHFERLSARRKMEVFEGWIRQARLLHGIHSRRGPTRPGPTRHGQQDRSDKMSQQQWEDFFAELDPSKQELLLAMPRDQMERQLHRMAWGRRRPNDQPPELRPRHDRASPPPDIRRHDRRRPPHDEPRRR